MDNENKRIISLDSSDKYLITTITDKIHSAVHCRGTKDLFLFSTSTGQVKYKEHDGTLLNDFNFIIPQAKHRWLTCCTELEIHSNFTRYFMFGTRRGSIHFVRRLDDGNLSELFSSEPIHGTNGVTDVRSCSTREATSCGRDGTIAIWNIETIDNVNLMRRIRTKMEWPIKLKNSFMYGFQSDAFHVIDAYGHTTFTSNCGGGHRSCQFWMDDDVGSLAFVRKGKVILEKNELKGYKLTTDGSGHSDHINAIVNINGTYATCSEDTKIVIGSVVLDSHKSSVRAIHFNGNHLISTGGKEVVCWYRVQISPHGKMRVYINM